MKQLSILNYIKQYQAGENTPVQQGGLWQEENQTHVFHPNQQMFQHHPGKFSHQARQLSGTVSRIFGFACELPLINWSLYGFA